jgi:hypothetical protein
MGTKIYLTNDIPSGSQYPYGNLADFSPKVIHNWPHSTQSLQMTTVSGASDQTLGGSFLVDPQEHYSHVRTFASRPIANNTTDGKFTISSQITFAGYMGCSHYRVRFPDTPDVITLSTIISPAVYMYVYRPSTGQTVGTLSHTTLSTFSLGDENRTFSITPSSVIASRGDRIISEIYFYHDPSGNWDGYAGEHFHYNDSNSYISFSDNLTFSSFIQRQKGFGYNLAYHVNKSDKFVYGFAWRATSSDKYTYNLGFIKRTKPLLSRYNVESYRYIELYMETSSAARGKASLRMTPRSTLSLGIGTEDYSQKWVLPEPSLHKFKMIDDFEGYYDLIDTAANWTVSDGAVTFSAIRNFISENLSDYDILTFYTLATQPTIIRTCFVDMYSVSSETMSFLITDRWQRNETSILWGNCNPWAIKQFKILGSYDGDVIVDDIFLLDYEPETENTNWMKMNLTDMDFGRSAKMSTFKIPFKQAETLQFLGENNGEGQLKVRSLDTMQSEFLGEMMKTNTPLYFRFKNMGMPIVFRNIERTFRQIIPREISSDINLPFYEIYDYSMY